VFLLSLTVFTPIAGAIELSSAAVRIDMTEAPPIPVQTAARMLSEEVAKRTGIDMPVLSTVDSRSAGISLRLAGNGELPAEGFRIELADGEIFVTGADPRGVLFGAGWLLRHFTYGEKSLRLDVALPVTSAPRYPLRGHQLGYRARANSWDAWTVAQFEQYIRELAIFGTNAIENIPFQDDDEAPLMPVPREEMNVRLSEICAEYGLEYWLWTPATFDLKDETLRAAELDRHEALYAKCPRLDAVFFPGGDPGDNHPREVIPFLEDIAARLHKHHPDSRVWVSLQGFDEEQINYFHTWLDEHLPTWLGGIVDGPGSPGILETRNRLPEQYPIRNYPDITHTVRCQYEVEWWDPAFSFTLGREPINPQPAYYAFIHNAFAPDTIGFLSYSDGAHDDLNKVIWSLRGWNPQHDVRDMCIEYARVFFPGVDAARVADGILALEKNWEGPLALNGAVDATLTYWQALEKDAPQLAGNWRWQMFLVRAYYDAYQRARLIREQALEIEAMAQLETALDAGDAEAGMAAALDTMRENEREPVAPAWRARIVELCDDLFDSIRLQTSVAKYGASAPERGCILDFVDYPLNNRRWLADEFEAIRAMEDAAAREARLRQIATWERNDPPHAYYDNIGAVGRCPRLVRGEDLGTDPNRLRDPNPTMWWWESGESRARLSWQNSLEYPVTLRYQGLDRAATYEFRLTGNGEAKPVAEGQALEPGAYSTEIGAMKVFPVPRETTADGLLEITFEKLDEDHLGWREKSHIAEAWLVVVE
jgi:hypothetical protein